MERETNILATIKGERNINISIITRRKFLYLFKADNSNYKEGSLFLLISEKDYPFERNYQAVLLKNSFLTKNQKKKDLKTFNSVLNSIVKDLSERGALYSIEFHYENGICSYIDNNYQRY